MPGATQSLVPYNQTIFTAVDGTTYKGKIDAVTAIAAQVAGSFYVYANNPAGMTVLVDNAFNYWQVGTGAVLNEAGSPVAVSIPAPGSNSYVATVYWDLITNAVGAVFGATGVSPTAIMPESVHQFPLAFVTVSSVTTSITASNIQDCRCVQNSSSILTKNLGIVATNQTVNCYGSNLVNINLSITTAVAISLTLSNLRIGAPVFIRYDNAQVTSENFKIIASTPNSVSYSVIGKNPNSTSINFTSTGMTAAGNTTFLLNGSSFLGPTLDLIIA